MRCKYSSQPTRNPLINLEGLSQKLKLKYWEYESQVVSQRVAEKCAILLIRCFQKGFELNKQEIKLEKLNNLNKSLDWE